MLKKLTLGVALTAVTGLVTALTVGGCSSSDTTTTSNPADSGPVDSSKPKIDSSVPEEDAASNCPKAITLTAADLKADPGFKAATASPGVCSEADIKMVETNSKDMSIKTWFDLAKGINPACTACLTSKDTDANWQPVVGTASNNGETGFYNFGACFGSVEGVACGEAIQFAQFCGNAACPRAECGATTTQRNQCLQKANAAGGPCAAFSDEVTKSCPKIQDTAKKCNNILDGMRTLCVGVADGGTD
jgi:hypothetical protein